MCISHSLFVQFWNFENYWGKKNIHSSEACASHLLIREQKYVHLPFHFRPSLIRVFYSEEESLSKFG